MLDFTEFNPDQLRLLIDADNQYAQWLSAKRQDSQFAGMWMSWREKNGTEYLTSGHSNGINQKSHGAKSPETIRVFEEFQEGKVSARVMLEAIQGRLSERAPQLKALKLGRILAPLAQVIREYFALHKAWVAERPDRNPLKKAKDLGQAEAVASLVQQFLPQYPFDYEFIEHLPEPLQKAFEEKIEPVLAQLGKGSSPSM